jgi:hypothetical protein
VIPAKKLETLLRLDVSDSAKITALLHHFEKDIGELSLLRGLTVQQVKTHLEACGPQHVPSDAAQKSDNENLTLYGLCAEYTVAFRQKFGRWEDQPNLRVIIRKAVQKYGAAKTKTILHAFLLSARTVEEAHLSRFYRLHVPPSGKA